MANASSLQRKLIHFIYQAVDPLPVYKQECLSVHLRPIVILVIGNQFHISSAVPGTRRYSMVRIGGPVSWEAMSETRFSAVKP